jgi:beta-N-acetylhexosaminidase
VDVNNNPANPVIRTRSFGDRADRVIDALEWVWRGHEAARVVTTVKHFPGHGDTNVDSHLGLPTIPYDRERIDAIELAPFRAAVAMGVPAIMSAHILFPALDTEVPATLSRPILTELLREEMGFDGLIFTDSMSMRAISERYGVPESAVLAKAAGVDVLEANESIANQMARHGALIGVLESGRIPREAFEATVRRLDAVRERYGITGDPTPLPERDPWRSKIAFDIALRSIAHVGVKPFQPLTSDEGAVFADFQRFRTTEAEDPVGRAQVLRDAVSTNLPGASVVTLSNDPTADEIALATARASEARTLVVMTRDASDLPDQVAIANRVITSAPKTARVVHCCMRGPYDAGTLVRVDDLVFTFGDPRVSIDAMVAYLTGNEQEPAHLPVEVPGLDELRDHIIFRRKAQDRSESQA